MAWGETTRILVVHGHPALGNLNLRHLQLLIVPLAF